MATRDHRSKDELSLHLPRMLCFHGGGTNSAIFRTQCRALTKMLQTTFRFCFVEAPYHSHPGPDVARIFEDMGPYKAWLRWRNEDQMRGSKEAVNRIYDSITTVMDEDDRCGATGEWVGLLGFSQGAKLCASILYTQQYSSEGLGDSSVWPCFRFAVLIAGRAPLVWLDAESAVPAGLVDAADLSTAQHKNLPPVPSASRLHVPTLHVHGLQDPGLRLHRELLHHCCDSTSTLLIEWEGAHRVPIKPADVTLLAQEILALARRTAVVT